MTEELLDRAKSLFVKLQRSKFELEHTGKNPFEILLYITGSHWKIIDMLGDAISNDLKEQIRKGLQERYDRLQAEFDALGNDGMCENENGND